MQHLNCFLSEPILQFDASHRYSEILKVSGYNGRVLFTIRDSRADDFETLWAIDQVCFIPGIAYSRAELKFFLRKRNAFTLIVEYPPSYADAPLQRIAGFTVAQVNPGATGHIITIDVLPGARRLGVGSLLLRSAEERLLASGCSIVSLETAVDNKVALAFYKRQGYFVTKTIPRYYSNGVNAFVLIKKLKD